MTESAPVAAAGKPHRIGPHYQLFILCLLLVGSQYELFVYLSLPFAYVAIVLGQWIVGVLNHAPTLVARSFMQASTSESFKYLAISGAEWSLLVCVWFLARSGNVRLFDFIGISRSRRQLCREVCSGIGLAVGEATYSALPLLLRTRHTPLHVDFVRPLSGEVILLIGVSLSAGVVEEIVYRGYLQRLLIDCLNNVWLAIGIQAVLFALAHLYEGNAIVVIIAIQSLLTGYLAYRLKNLRLVIVAHCTLDFLVGLLGLL
jgi:membrane protease YdiL (CAAX protease family)